MKVKLEFETSAQEIRSLFGLPDIAPLQEEIVRRLRERMAAGLPGFDPLSLLKPVLPENLRTFEQLQKYLWDALGQATTGGKPPSG